MSLSYDVFISYSRTDAEWVAPGLYVPLARARRRDGRSPRIFFDADAIETGTHWRATLAAAIKDCGHFVPVFSQSYFESELCQWELDLAHSRDLRARAGLVLPVKIDGVIVPFEYSAIQFVTPDRPDWLRRLSARMDLEGATASRVAVATQLHQDLLADLRRLSGASTGPFQVRVDVVAPGETRPRRIGDRVDLCITVTRDAYVYAFDIGTTGVTTLLFPNEFAPANLLPSGVPVQLPGAAPYDLVLSGAPGIEVIQVFALDRPLEALRDGETRPSSAGALSVPRLTRDVRILAHAASTGDTPVSVAFAQLEFVIESP